MQRARVAGRMMDRREFLRLGGVGIAGAALLATTGVGTVVAEPGSSLEAEFEEAAGRYGVPREMLLAMGYVNTRWEMPPPGVSDYENGTLDGKGTYGIMALVRNPSQDTLGEAARLTGIDEETLKTDRRSNVLGGAALLAASQGKKPATLGDWLGAVNGRGGNGKLYKAVAGVGGGELYAEQVLQTLVAGATALLRNGETVALAAQNLAALTTLTGRVI